MKSLHSVKPADGRLEFPEVTDQWLLICLDKETCRAVIDCGDARGFDAEIWPKRGIKPPVNGKLIAVVAASHGPDRQRALEVIEECRAAGAIRVHDVPLHGLGDVYPDLAAYREAIDLANTLFLSRFWLPQLPADAIDIAATNGNGRCPILNGTVNYSVLTAGELNILDASEIKVKRIEWVWPHRFAAGEMSLLAGEGGLGKSQILLWIASAISKGWEWPDKSGAAPLGTVIIVTAEDAPETTIKPRLMALGADLTKIKIIPAPKVMIQEHGKDLVVKFQWLTDHGYWNRVFDLYPDAKLMIMDPIVSYLGRGVNDQRNDEVRTSIEPFLEVIIRPRSVGFLGNTHLNKSLENKNMVHRITGSIAYVNLPRNVHVVFRDPDNPEVRIFGQCKSNNAPDDLKAFAFKIVKQMIQTAVGEIETSMPKFEKEMVTLDLKRASDMKNRTGPKPVKSLEDARWLFKQLERGPVRLGTLIDDARQVGIIGEPSEDGERPSPSPLYNAQRRVPDAHPGWYVDEFKVDSRKHWQVLQGEAPQKTPESTEPSQTGEKPAF